MIRLEFNRLKFDIPNLSVELLKNMDSIKINNITVLKDKNSSNFILSNHFKLAFSELNRLIKSLNENKKLSSKDGLIYYSTDSYIYITTMNLELKLYLVIGKHREYFIDMITIDECLNSNYKKITRDYNEYSELKDNSHIKNSNLKCIYPIIIQ